MEDPRIISALFIFLKMAYYNVLINTLSTYIRNSIDHPDPIKRPYTSSELQSSIDLLIEICNSIP